MTPDGFYNLLEYYPTTNTYILTERDGTVYTFINNPPSSMLYALSSITDRNGNQMLFSYDGQHRLSSITDTLSRTITFSYTNLNRIAHIQDWSNRQVVFGYDANGDLISVRSPVTFDYPQGKTTHYTYSAGLLDIRMNHKLLTVTDPKEQVYLTNYYDEKGRVETQSYGPAKFHNEYTDATGSKPARVLVTDRNDNQTESWLTPQGNVITETKYTRGIRPGDPASFTTVYEHITSTERSKTIFPKGNSVEYLYDINNPDPKAKGNLLQVTRNSLTGPPYQLITLFTYELRYNQIKTMTDASGNVTTFYYDYELGGPNHGNVVRIDYPIVRHGLAATAHGGEQVIQAYFQYNANGQITQSTSPEGSVDTYEYYGDGSPMRGYLHIIHRDINDKNITNIFEYNSVGNITKIYDGKGNATTFQVNQLNQVTKTISRPPFNYEVKFDYDANDNLSKTQIQNKDRNGVLDPDMPWLNTFYYYNSLDNLTRKMEAIELGKTQPYEPAEVIEYATTQYGYDTNENRNLITQPEGNQVRHTYDERDLLWETIRGYGTAEWATTTKRYYDINGNLEKTKDGRGKETSYQVDGFDRVIGYTDAVGNQMIRELDANGNVTRVVRKNASGVTLSDTKYLYDEMNRNYEVQEWLDTTQTWVITQKEFDKNSRVVKVVDANNHQTTATYDGLNRVTKTEDHLGNHVDYILDANSNVITTTEYEKNITGTFETFVTYNEYDNLDRLIRSTNPINVTRQAFFDSRTNLTYTIDGEGNTASNVYDGINRLKQVTRDMRQGGHGGGSIFDTIVTKYLWDKNSRLKNLTDDKNNTTSYTYDALNRRKKEIYPDARYKEFFYDASDNIYRMTDPNGNQIDNTFDDINRLTHRAITKGTGVIGVSYEDFGYDGLSRMTSAVNDYSSVNMGYDTLSRLLTEQQQIGGFNARTVSSEYDSVGFRNKITYPSGKVVNLTPDNLDRIYQIKDVSQNVIAQYTYAGPFRVTGRSYYNGTNLAVMYDANRRPITYTHGTTIGGFEYAYDKEDNKLFEKRTYGTKGDAYVYDSIYRLTGVKYGVPNTELNPATDWANYNTYDSIEQFNLDGVGNRINMYNGVTTTYTTNNLNQYTQISATNLTYDYNGNLTNDGTYTYSYDYANRLMEVKQGETSIATFKYDALGRRIEKVTASATVHYYLDGGRVIEERDGENSDTLVATYLHGNGIDELLQAEYPIDSDQHPISGTYYFHENTLGSIYAVTDEDGNVMERYKYDAYGKVSFFNGSDTPISNSALGNCYLYTGREYDPEIKLYNYRARYYSPELGRFLNRDPIADDYLLNLYAYVNNNSINLIDPFGLYGADVHLGLPDRENPDGSGTYLWAWKSAGFSPHDAEIIAKANQSVDDLTPAVLADVPQRNKLHFSTAAEAEAGLRRVINSCGNLALFGKALHTYQDSFSHKGLTPALHLAQSIASKLSLIDKQSPPVSDPDKFGDDPSDVEMEEGTKKWLKELMAHRDKHLPEFTGIITANPILTIELSPPCMNTITSPSAIVTPSTEKPKPPKGNMQYGRTPSPEYKPILTGGQLHSPLVK